MVQLRTTGFCQLLGIDYFEDKSGDILGQHIYQGHIKMLRTTTTFQVNLMAAVFTLNGWIAPIAVIVVSCVPVVHKRIQGNFRGSRLRHRVMGPQYPGKRL